MQGQTFVIEIDLNALDANRVTLVHEEFIVEPNLRTSLPEVGETVIALDEWNVRYPAVVDSIENGFLSLSVKLDSPFPSPVSPPFERTDFAYYPTPLLTSQTGSSTSPDN